MAPIASERGRIWSGMSARGPRAQSDGGSSRRTGALRLREERPVQVINTSGCETEGFTIVNSDNSVLFYKEANIGSEQRREFLSRFEKFYTSGEDGAKFFTLSNWLNFNSHYKLTKTEYAEHYFRAMDRFRTGQVTAEQLFLACVAANPGTPHILNSHTGYTRTRYLFDYYDEDHMGSLNFEQLCTLVADTRFEDDKDEESVLETSLRFAQECGQFSIVTVWVEAVGVEHGEEHLCEFRASRQWSGRRLRQEVARRLGITSAGMELAIGSQLLQHSDCLGFVGGEDGPVTVTVTAARWQEPATLDEVLWSADVPGLEKLVHVPFLPLYQAVASEKLRGTSRLFRFHRAAYQPRSRERAAARTTVRATMGGA